MTITVVNSIIWDNEATTTQLISSFEDENQIAVADEDDAYQEVTMDVRHTLIELGCHDDECAGGNCGSTTNLTGGDPYFRNPTGTDTDYGTLDDDLRLFKNSPLFDIGDNAAGAGSYDLAGRTRIQSTVCDDGEYEANGTIDLGPYEAHNFGIVHVDVTKTSGDNTGEDWDNAYTDLQTALTAAANLDVCEVWVADGTYKPDNCTSCGAGDRDSSFVLPDGLRLYGGWRGTQGDNDRNNTTQRNPATYVTTMSGLVGSATIQRVYHVVTVAAGMRSAPHFDGFKVTNGRADGSSDDKDKGGGLLMKSNATFQTCTFDSNKAKLGGGMYAVGVPILDDCTFTNNEADDGGGGGKGGALVVNIGGNPNLGVAARRCNFNNNESKDDAGAVYVQTIPNGMQFINCLFYQNEADKDDSTTNGGALVTVGSVALINCTLSRNQCGTSDGGGGLYHESGGTLQLKNCILWGNMTSAASLPDAEADQIKIASGTATATYTCIQNIDGLGGETNTGADPLFASAGTDNYDLSPDGCFNPFCLSSCIDQSYDANCDSICQTKDAKKRTRKVKLDNRTYKIDRGALETQSAP
ncbi:MAG: hypothetical protein IT449_06990 [Phycisphaerales bacterium]|nr:hypothetical protein [Phycisphaerales bacterium]